MVASFTDAWIETPENTKGLGTLTSHLLQMRGLKQEELNAYKAKEQSHLLQMRGLKQGWQEVPQSRIESHLLQMRGLKHHLK